MPAIECIREDKKKQQDQEKEEEQQDKEKEEQQDEEKVLHEWREHRESFGKALETGWRCQRCVSSCCQKFFEIVCSFFSASTLLHLLTADHHTSTFPLLAHEES
jgi:hypothetical protein